MSVQHMAMVFAANDLPGPERLLLLALTNRTDAHGYCYPGVDRLADETGTSQATVYRNVARLEARDLVMHKRRWNDKGEPITNLYRVNLPLLASMRRPDRDYADNVLEELTFTSPPADLGKRGTSQSEREVPLNLRGGTSQSEREVPLNLRDNPSVEPSVEPSPHPAEPFSSSCAQPQGARADRGGFAEEETKSRLTSKNAPSADALALLDDAVAHWSSKHRHPRGWEKTELAHRIDIASANGATDEGIVRELTRDLRPDQVRQSAIQVVMGRTKATGWGTALDPRPEGARYRPRPLPPVWCGSCHEATRLVEDAPDHAVRCPACHPNRTTALAAEPEHQDVPLAPEVAAAAKEYAAKQRRAAEVAARERAEVKLRLESLRTG